jgi:hypothetical protein
MLRHYAVGYLSAWRALTGLEHTLGLKGLMPKSDPDLEKLLDTCVERIELECMLLPVSNSLRAQIERVREAIPQVTFEAKRRETFLILLGELRLNLDNELAGHLFYVVAEKHAHLMEGPEPFGTEVHSCFSEAAEDMRASARCLALDEGTACVFHSMRVLEHGLRALAKHVGLGLSTTPLELSEWMNIIEQTEKAIRGLEKLPKGAAKAEKLRACSEAASQFRYFKDAWRNHVSHSRVHYDSRQAEIVWSHTKEFMATLATIVKRKSKGKGKP